MICDADDAGCAALTPPRLIILRLIVVLRTDSCGRCQDLWDSDDVIGGGSKNKEPFYERSAAMTGLAHHANSFHPAKRFFDPLALDLTYSIAGMPCGPFVDRR